MTLLPIDQINELILVYPELTQERRQFIADFIQGTDPDGHLWLDNPDLPPEEIAFLRALFGVNDDTRPLPVLTPSEDQR